MNTIHDNGENDRSLLESLDKIGHAYTQAEPEEPPELLDMAILNRARREAEKKPHWMKFGWLHGLTTAAVFVLALSLIVRQQENRPVDTNGIGREVQPRATLEKAVKEQPLELRLNESAPEFKDQGDARVDEPRAAPPPAAADAAADSVAADAYELLQAATPAARELKVEEAAGLDEDLGSSAGVSAEAAAPKAASTGQAARAEPVSERRQSFKALQPATPAAEAPVAVDAEAEEQIQAILEMRERGDDNWKTELQAFIENHPGYPLPDALKD